MKRLFTSTLIATAVLSTVSIQPVFGAAAEIPSAFLSTFSFYTAAAGASGAIIGWHGGGTLNRIFLGLGSIGLGVLDPDPGVFLSGLVTIHYPADLLSVESIGWFGPFAADPSLPVPPVGPGPFSDSGGAVYNVGQAPNPALSVSTTDSGGVLTISFDASPGGITSASLGSFNLLAIRFENISDTPLVIAPVPLPVGGPIAAQETANLFLNSAQSSLTCIPDSSVNKVPVSCSANAQPIGFTVTPIPEPDGLALAGLIGLVAYGRWKLRTTSA